MKNMKLILLAIVAVLLTATCEKDENGQRITYYKTIGEGYIYERDGDKPLKGVKITVISRTSSFTGSDPWELSVSRPYTQETFTTDKNGHYQLRFAKRVGGHKVENYRFELDHFSALSYPPPPALFWYWETSQGNTPFPKSFVYIYSSDIKNENIITFNTVKYYYNEK